MSYVTIIWSMVASACLTLGVVHLLVWCKKRTAWANLLFSLTAVATAAMAFYELRMMWAETPGQFGTALRWVHVPVFVLILALVGFVLVYLRAGRRWLAWTACAVRAFSLLLNFLMEPNVNYREITRLRHISFLSDSISVCEGVPSVWNLVGHLSLILLVIFVADAAITVWRRGDRRQAVVVGGSIVFFVLAATVQTMLARWEVFHWPETAVVFFVGIVVAMDYEMTREVLRAAQLSEDLLESETRMTMAAEAAGVGVWMWNIARNQIWASEIWRRLFGFPCDAAVTLEDVIQRVHPDDRERVEHAVRRTLADGDDYAGEYRVVLPDGAERWVVAHGRIHPEGNGKPSRMLGATMDITERKRQEQENEHQRNQLMHLSRVTMLGELSGSLAHELNQPLAIILTNAQAAQRLLAQQPPDLAEACDILADIVSEDERAGQVIRRLRALLKHGETTIQPLSVNEVTEEVLHLLRNDLIRQGVTVEHILSTDVPRVLGDPIQLQQVLLNLILNACDAMAANPPAGRRLTVATAHGNGVVHVSISDTGCGLPADAERIFAPFYTTRKQGLGLGLSICRTIVTAHKGRLWAEPQTAADVPAGVAAPSRGTTFHMELPAAREGKS